MGWLYRVPNDLTRKYLFVGISRSHDGNHSSCSIVEVLLSSCDESTSEKLRRMQERLVNPQPFLKKGELIPPFSLTSALHT